MNTKTSITPMNSKSSKTSKNFRHPNWSAVA
jgi:hypothetical protein